MQRPLPCTARRRIRKSGSTADASSSIAESKIERSYADLETHAGQPFRSHLEKLVSRTDHRSSRERSGGSAFGGTRDNQDLCAPTSDAYAGESMVRLQEERRNRVTHAVRGHNRTGGIFC